MKAGFAERIRAHTGIDDSLIEYCAAAGRRYIYGNGAQAATCLGFFREMEVPIDGLLTLPGYEMPELKGYWGRLLRAANTIPVTGLTVEQCATSSVLIASPRESYPAARVMLEQMGFQNIYTCAWKRNQCLRDICMAYFEENY